MAKCASVGFSTYCSYEKGESFPKADALHLWAGHGVDVLFVITGQADASALTTDEATMLNYWRSSPDALRSAWLAFYQTYTAAIRYEGR